MSYSEQIDLPGWADADADSCIRPGKKPRGEAM